MYYSWYMGLCEFLRLLHYQYTFFFSEKPKEIAQCIFNEQIATKKPPYVENMIHVKTHICKLLYNYFF